MCRVKNMCRVRNTCRVINMCRVRYVQSEKHVPNDQVVNQAITSEMEIDFRKKSRKNARRCKSTSEFDRKQTQTSTNEHVANRTKTESKRKIQVCPNIRKRTNTTKEYRAITPQHVQKSIRRGEEKKRRRNHKRFSLFQHTLRSSENRSFTKISVIWNLQILAYFIHIVCRRHKKTLYSRALKEYKFARTIVKGVIVKKKAISCKHDQQQRLTLALARQPQTCNCIEIDGYQQLNEANRCSEEIIPHLAWFFFCRLLKRVEYLLE